MPTKKYLVETDQGKFMVEVEEPSVTPEATLPQEPAQPSASDAFLSSAAMGLPADVVRGVAKGAARTALAAGELIRHIPGVTKAVDTLYGQPGLSDRAFTVAHEAMAPTNAAQTVGGLAETAAEMAIPITKAAGLLPSTAKAGAKFQEVMGAAKNIPVDVNAPGEVALRIQQLAERGSSMPMAVNKFLRHITDPEKPAMTYEVARDFASNISRLSANEYQRLTPVVAREVAALRVTLNKAVAEAAGKAGKGKEYVAAMNEYAKAMRIKGAVDSAVEGAKRTLPYATAAGAGYWLTTKVRSMLGE